MRLLTLVAAVIALTACVPPKIMVAYTYLDTEKSAKTHMQRSGATADIGGNQAANLFDVGARVCDVKPNNTETNCKDSLIMQNVVPGSVY